jgi:hypothetical protein
VRILFIFLSFFTITTELFGASLPDKDELKLCYGQYPQKVTSFLRNADKIDEIYAGTQGPKFAQYTSFKSGINLDDPLEARCSEIIAELYVAVMIKYYAGRINQLSCEETTLSSSSMSWWEAVSRDFPDKDKCRDIKNWGADDCLTHQCNLRGAGLTFSSIHRKIKPVKDGCKNWDHLTQYIDSKTDVFVEDLGDIAERADPPPRVHSPITDQSIAAIDLSVNEQCEFINLKKGSIESAVFGCQSRSYDYVSKDKLDEATRMGRPLYLYSGDSFQKFEAPDYVGLDRTKGGHITYTHDSLDLTSEAMSMALGKIAIYEQYKDDLQGLYYKLNLARHGRDQSLGVAAPNCTLDNFEKQFREYFEYDIGHARITYPWSHRLSYKPVCNDFLKKIPRDEVTSFILKCANGQRPSEEELGAFTKYTEKFLDQPPDSFQLTSLTSYVLDMPRLLRKGTSSDRCLKAEFDTKLLGFHIRNQTSPVLGRLMEDYKILKTSSSYSMTIKQAEYMNRYLDERFERASCNATSTNRKLAEVFYQGEPLIRASSRVRDAMKERKKAAKQEWESYVLASHWFTSAEDIEKKSHELGCSLYRCTSLYNLVTGNGAPFSNLDTTMDFSDRDCPSL